MRSLYLQSKIFQWTVALLFLMSYVLLVLAATLGVAFMFGLQLDDPAHTGIAVLSQFVLLLPFWMLVSLFLLAPLFRLTGVLRYYSPYLIGSSFRRDRIELHGATPFDYFLLFRWRDRGRPAVRRILIWYIEGLVTLAREIEDGSIPIDSTISATSYVFSASSAKRYGFTVDESPRFAFGGFLTYPTQFLTYSFSKGSWGLPPVRRARRATIEGAGLRSQIVQLERLLRRLRDVQNADRNRTSTFLNRPAGPI